MKDSIKPVITIGRTGALVHDPEITYNEAGISYNEAGYAYGGIYGNDIYPQISSAKSFDLVATAKNIKPVLIGKRTNAQIYDQNYTYNQSGFSYNEAGVGYGGIYENDILPFINKARNIVPSIRFGGDFSGTAAAQHGTVILHAGMPMGPGFFMYITYPVDGTVIF